MSQARQVHIFHGMRSEVKILRELRRCADRWIRFRNPLLKPAGSCCGCASTDRLEDRGGHVLGKPWNAVPVSVMFSEGKYCRPLRMVYAPSSCTLTALSWMTRCGASYAVRSRTPNLYCFQSLLSLIETNCCYRQTAFFFTPCW
jgi:hypothetical protein